MIAASLLNFIGAPPGASGRLRQSRMHVRRPRFDARESSPVSVQCCHRTRPQQGCRLYCPFRSSMFQRPKFSMPFAVMAAAQKHYCERLRIVFMMGHSVRCSTSLARAPDELAGRYGILDSAMNADLFSIFPLPAMGPLDRSCRVSRAASAFTILTGKIHATPFTLTVPAEFEFRYGQLLPATSTCFH